VEQNSTQIYGKATFDWEYPTSAHTGLRVPSPFHQFMNSGCFTSQFGGLMKLIALWLFSCISILLVCTLLNHTGAQYSAVEYTNDNEAARNIQRLLTSLCQSVSAPS
jgi:hypothetical protein